MKIRKSNKQTRFDSDYMSTTESKRYKNTK